MQITKRYFELIPLFKNATVSQFLFLLQHPVNIFRDISNGSMCLACGLLCREERTGKFLNESPKFNFDDLQTIFKWVIANKVSGGVGNNMCSDTLNLIAGLAVTEEIKVRFLEWAKTEALAY